MNAIVYVNTPLEAPEHAALAALARREGRAKGQQLRLLAIQAMRRNPMPAGSDSYAAHVRGPAAAKASAAHAPLATAGDDGEAKRQRRTSRNTNTTSKGGQV